MNVMAIALVLAVAVAATASVGIVAWGLVLESRSNREWRERGLAL